MENSEIVQFMQRLAVAYPQMHLTEVLADLWIRELRFVETGDVQEAFRRYAMDNQPQYPPTLTRLLQMTADVRRERRTQELRRERQAQEGQTLGEVLQQAASRVNDRDINWAREHVAMFLAGVSKPGRAAEAVAWCERKAQEYPEDGQDWLREANTYRLEIDHGRRMWV